MKIIKIIALIGIISMSVVLLNGFINGNFFEDGSTLMQNPWGIVSLVDLYVGFLLFSIWIVYRESSWNARIIWVVFMMIFGFLTASVYVFYAVHTARGDTLKAIHGYRASQYITKGSNDEPQ